MLNFKPIVYYNIINQVISFWPRKGPRSVVLAQHVRHVCRSEKKQEMTSMLLESYWPSCICIGQVVFVLAELLCFCSLSHMIWTAFAI